MSLIEYPFKATVATLPFLPVLAFADRYGIYDDIYSSSGGGLNDA